MLLFLPCHLDIFEILEDLITDESVFIEIALHASENFVTLHLRSLLCLIWPNLQLFWQTGHIKQPLILFHSAQQNNNKQNKIKIIKMTKLFIQFYLVCHLKNNRICH
jgi:hypothetical protein